MKPKTIERKNYQLFFVWEDGHESQYTMSYLRRKCPCAECKNLREQSPDKTLELEHLDHSVFIKDYVQMGNYALRFYFSDEHHDGIFAYDYLRSICYCELCVKLFS